MHAAHAIRTIGHSNRDITEFLDIVEAHGIETIVDVRQFPGSRRLPHFGQDQLCESLASRGVGYVHLRDLGGRRRRDPDAPADVGDAWRNSSFRAYAQYTHTPEYADALDELLEIAASSRVAIMCSEAVPWRCHRWLVSDTLTARGIDVLHVIDEGTARVHWMSPFAQVEDGVVSWPGPESDASLKLGPRATDPGAARS